MTKRYVLEGEWSGYVPRQQHVCHREVVTGKRVEALKKLHTIQYTDGTTLRLSLRKAAPREKVDEIRSYNSLIRQAEVTGRSYVRVSDLPD